MKILPVLLALALPACLHAAEWESLFDGKTLEGWVAKPDRGCWSVMDGVLTGVENAENQGSNLQTVRRYKDFILEVEMKWNKEANSGLLLRANHRININVGMSPSEKRDTTGSLFISREGGYVATAQVEGIVRQEDWNQFRVELIGPKITIFLNGEKIVEHDKLKFVQPGPICFQVFRQTPGMKVEVRNVRVQDLAPQ